LFEATSYEQALFYYRAAQKYGDKLTTAPVTIYEQIGDHDGAWTVLPLRGYLRAIAGEANTLRKMGKYQEALQIYERLDKLDNNAYEFSTFVAYRVAVPECYIRLGQYKKAKEYMAKHIECIQLPSGQTWLWNMALIYFVTHDHEDRWQEEYYEKSTPNGANSLIFAILSCPLTCDYLLGQRKLCPAKISSVYLSKGTECAKMQQIMYVANHLDLWVSTPGAIEWFTKNYNTFMMTHIFRNDTKLPKKFGYKDPQKALWQIFALDFYPDARAHTNGMYLVHFATVFSSDPNKVKLLLDNSVSLRTRFNLTPTQMAAYYDLKEILAMLIDYGADPLETENSPYSMACNQGNYRCVDLVLDRIPKTKLTQSLLSKGFQMLFDSTVYECVKGIGPKCQRCKGDSHPHSDHVDFEKCIDALINHGLKLSSQEIMSASRAATKSSLLQYTQMKMLMRQSATSITNTSTPAITSKGVTKCNKCGKQEESQKFKACSACKQVVYCSVACQKADWNAGHRTQCKILQQK
jgi:hypothetical protein